MEEDKVKTPNKGAFNSKIVLSFVAGVVLTLVSLVILGFNLSTAGGIKINDDVNRYFDTCVGEGFVDSTPSIRTEERGFPLAFMQKSYVPVCENTGVELKKNDTTTVDWGALGANVLFWTCLTFVILRKFTRRASV
ncbi:MAG: hypothetical protein M3Q36_02990 [bacterium]|nr:hypothetical protein [bacterium]